MADPAGGSLILHGEHYHPVYLSPNPHPPGSYNTIPQFKCVLRQSGFEPIVYRSAFSGGRHPLLKRALVRSTGRNRRPASPADATPVRTRRAHAS